mmetsp:Transcript_4406/g.8115  ORF Transcript_4406/g.8115 Transcript_4406/m.8115 type:complete len:363 (+) Transcript_4406:1972-3060(+)
MMAKKSKATGMSNKSLGYKVVGEQHVFLHQSVGIPNRVRSTKHGSFTIFFKLKRKFDTIQGQRSILKTKTSSSLRNFMHQTHIGSNLIDCMFSTRTSTCRPRRVVHFMSLFASCNLAVNDILGCCIIEASTRLNNTFSIPHVVILFLAAWTFHRTVHIHSPHTRECQAFHVFIKTASNLTQWTRKHGYSPVHQIDCRGSTHGFLVNSRTWLNKMTHICNMHSNLDSAIRQGLDVKSIIQIFGSSWINGKDSLLPKITSSLVHFRCGSPTKLLIGLHFHTRLDCLVYIFQDGSQKVTMVHIKFDEQCLRFILDVARHAHFLYIDTWRFGICFFPRSMYIFCFIQTLLFFLFGSRHVWWTNKLW